MYWFQITFYIENFQITEYYRDRFFPVTPQKNLLLDVNPALLIIKNCFEFYYIFILALKLVCAQKAEQYVWL